MASFIQIYSTLIKPVSPVKTFKVIDPRQHCLANKSSFLQKYLKSSANQLSCLLEFIMARVRPSKTLMLSILYQLGIAAE